MNTTADAAIERYLKRLDSELADLPPARRREIVEEISEHIAAAQADHPAESEAEIRTLLDRLGDPGDIAAEARQRFDIRPARPGWLETAALVLLLVGGFTFLGWFIGLALLWSSAVWTTRDKLIGSLIVPGGLVLPVALFMLASSSSNSTCIGRIESATGRTIGETCTGGGTSAGDILALVLLVLLVAAPIFTTAYLARRMRRPVELATAS
jgi:uncharacterized membrane protein